MMTFVCVFLAAFGLGALAFGLYDRFKPQVSLVQAQELFLLQYGYLWYPNYLGGITTVGMKPADDYDPVDYLTVGIASSQAVWDVIPNTFEGYKVVKSWVLPAEHMIQGV